MSKDYPCPDLLQDGEDVFHLGRGERFKEGSVQESFRQKSVGCEEDCVRTSLIFFCRDIPSVPVR